MVRQFAYVHGVAEISILLGKKNTRCSYRFSSHTKNTTTPKTLITKLRFLSLSKSPIKNHATLFGSGHQTKSNKIRLHKAQHNPPIVIGYTPYPIPPKKKKKILQLLNPIRHTNRASEQQEIISILKNVLFNKVNLPPFDKHSFFQLDNLRSIFSKIGFHTKFSLKDAPKGIPR